MVVIECIDRITMYSNEQFIFRVSLSTPSSNCNKEVPQTEEINIYILLNYCRHIKDCISYENIIPLLLNLPICKNV